MKIDEDEKEILQDMFDITISLDADGIVECVRRYPDDEHEYGEFVKKEDFYAMVREVRNNIQQQQEKENG